MKLEVMLSVMNLNKKKLDKMNITTKCTVINQCGKNGYERYKNFDIYSYDEIGAANSRKRGLSHEIGFTKAYKQMILGSKDYIRRCLK